MSHFSRSNWWLGHLTSLVSISGLGEKDINTNGFLNNMGIIKKSKYRYQWGDLDLISIIIFGIGLYLTQTNGCFIYNFSCIKIGFGLMMIGLLKQLSKK